MHPAHNVVPNTIHFNPKFKNAHINPSLLHSLERPAPNNIFINPKFLTRLALEAELPPPPSASLLPLTHTVCQLPDMPAQSGQLLQNTRRKLVRAAVTTPEHLKSKTASTHRTPLVKVGKNKLIRASQLFNVRPVTSIYSPKTPKMSLALRSKYKIIHSFNTSPGRTTALRKSTLSRLNQSPLISKYTIRRSNLNETLTPTRIRVANRKSYAVGSTPSQAKFQSPNSKSPIFRNKTLELLNINGVIYRSSKNKLQKATADRIKQPSTTTPERGLFVRGDKFILAGNGKKLVRVQSSSEQRLKLKRIDIGGLTYVAKSNNTYEQTNSHKTRSHLSNIKQKSIYLLASRLVKSNLPCPIYRRLGKCVALERGKCPKVHNPLQIDVCQKFVHDKCTSENCTLSHHISLAKMPTCKFYLLQRCSNQKCPYLHKVVEDGTPVCKDFLQGYCALADQCTKRHDFVCVDFEATGSCIKTRCPYHKQKKPGRVKTAMASDKNASTSVEDKSDRGRYYFDTGPADEASEYGSGSSAGGSAGGDGELTSKTIEEAKDEVATVASDDGHGDDGDVYFCRPKRVKIGDLPSFIPIE